MDSKNQFQTRYCRSWARGPKNGNGFLSVPVPVLFTFQIHSHSRLAHLCPLALVCFSSCLVSIVPTCSYDGYPVLVVLILLLMPPLRRSRRRNNSSMRGRRRKREKRLGPKQTNKGFIPKHTKRRSVIALLSLCAIDLQTHTSDYV